MPRGMVLLAALLLLILIGIAGVAGLLRPNEPNPTRELAVFTGGNPERGRETIRQNGCPTCHIITGIKEARGQVGRRSTTSRSASTLRCLPNTPDNLLAWIKDPPGIDPLTAMPASGLDEADARDVAAYLYTLD
jgi:cytochrome c